MIQSYNKKEGIDYGDTFAPLARMEVIRILIAFTSYMEFKLFQIDVKSASLNGDLLEEVYIKQPLGFEDIYVPNPLLTLDKNLYELKQASRA